MIQQHDICIIGGLMLFNFSFSYYYDTMGILQLLTLLATIISYSYLLSPVAAFPLESPCLQSCANDEITASILQKCINQCLTLNHCGGNRLNDECKETSNQKLSCANGCEIAYYRSTVEECKSDCADGNSNNGCDYKHPNIPSTFKKCGICQAGCDQGPELSACSDGCDLAAQFEQNYQHNETVQGNFCKQDDIPRFLFAGQSNMVRLQKKS
jgi:hypothetical protein